MDYNTMTLNQLHSAMDGILTELDRRTNEYDQYRSESKKDVNLLNGILGFKEPKSSYNLRIEEEKTGFVIGWSTEGYSHSEQWNRTDGKTGIPDEGLLMKEPLAWFEKFKAGTYPVELVDSFL